jgi:hypothetical protein
MKKKKINLTVETMAKTLASLKGVLDRDRTPQSLTRRDLVDLTAAGGHWKLPPSEIPDGELAKIQNADTKPGSHKGAALDLKNDTDFTDAAFDANTHLDDFSRTDAVSRVADELAAKLSSSKYRSMSADELKAALEIELKNYLR